MKNNKKAKKKCLFWSVCKIKQFLRNFFSFTYILTLLPLLKKWKKLRLRKNTLTIFDRSVKLLNAHDRVLFGRQHVHDLVFARLYSNYHEIVVRIERVHDVVGELDEIAQAASERERLVVVHGRVHRIFLVLDHDHAEHAWVFGYALDRSREIFAETF